MACTTTPPIIAGFTTLPSPSITDQTEFCNAVFTYYSELGTFVQDANNLATWVKVTTETACTAKQDAQTAKQDAQTAATNAANSAIEAQAQVDLAQQIVADAEANVIAAGQAQVDLAEQFADAAAISANDAQNSATTSEFWAQEALESAGVAAAIVNLQFGGFYVSNGRLYAAVNNLAVSMPYISNGRFYVEIF